MKLQELKEEALSSWELINRLYGTVCTEQLFKADMRKYGDLRRKATWERACIALEAHWVLKGLENRYIVDYFCHPDTPIGMAYNQEVLDVLLTFPTAIEQIKNGLERLYYDPRGAGDRQDAENFLKRLSSYEELRTHLQGYGRALTPAAA